jgi:hypothetical protein
MAKNSGSFTKQTKIDFEKNLAISRLKIINIFRKIHKQKILCENERLKISEWVKNNLPLPRYKYTNPEEIEEYKKICYSNEN